MDNRQQVLHDAVAAGDLPFVVAMQTDATGPIWQGAAGEAAPGQPADPETVFRIFSMTKAIGALAAMILIDRGQVTADTPVDTILPEFADLPVLDGFDGDTPRLRPQRSRATLRHLATHSSGLEYEFWNADIARYLRLTGRPTALAGTRAALNYPLAFDPGTRWGYGIGIDWLGLCVAAIDGRPVQRFVTEDILTPLGMRATAFEPTPEMAARLAGVWARQTDGTLAPTENAPPPGPEVYGMGHALYSTPADYLRFLRMVLRGGVLDDGGRLLSPAAHAAYVGGGGPGFVPMRSAKPRVSADVDLFPGLPCTHGMGFVRVERDVPGRRRAGSLFWAGVLNTHYWIDPARGQAAVLMTQSLPFADPRVMAVLAGFETETCRQT